MQKVLVTGAAGAVGAATVRMLSQAGVDEIIGIDHNEARLAVKGYQHIEADLLDVDLKELFTGVDAVIHAAWDPGPHGGTEFAPEENIKVLDRVLDATAAASVGHFAFTSCAVVYGARPENAIPLMETATRRPNTSYPFAIQKAEAEVAIELWAPIHPDIAVSVLRPSVIISGPRESEVAKVLGGHRVTRSQGADHPVQFVHGDDVASALVHLVANRLDGTYNVAPDGYIFDELARELAGTSSRVRVPVSFRASARRLFWSLGRSEDAPAVEPYVENPWVISNDALKATGWKPAFTNEETLVSLRPITWWGRQSPERRRALLVSSAGTGIAAVVSGAVAGSFALFGKRRKGKKSKRRYLKAF